MSAASQPSQPVAALQPGQKLVNILTPAVKIKASSGSSREAKGILDGSLETCWTSETPPPEPTATPTPPVSTLTFTLPATVPPLPLSSLHSLAITFAGGFSATQTRLLRPIATDPTSASTQWTGLTEPMYPVDSNARQFFRIESGGDQNELVSSFRLELLGSTDEYGRVTVYQVELYAVQ